VGTPHAALLRAYPDPWMGRRTGGFGIVWPGRSGCLLMARPAIIVFPVAWCKNRLR
jgi:hypothetical protein